MKALGTVIILALLSCLIAGEEVTFYPCSDETTTCKIQQVNVSPCAEAAAGKPCKLKRGNTATISFEYKPFFEADSDLVTDAFWASPDGDLPWAGVDKTACSYTACPILKDATNVFSYNVKVDKYAPPVSSFDLWLLLRKAL